MVDEETKAVRTHTGSTGAHDGNRLDHRHGGKKSFGQ